jgi:LuxR family maltose regulon positive regulatory protein
MITTKRPEKSALNTLEQRTATHQWQDELSQQALYAWANSKGKRPEFAPHFLSRKGLIDQAFQQHDVVWLNSAAGYGKTLLMSEYCSALEDKENPYAVLWFRCDEKDGSNNRFIYHLLAASERQLEGVATNALAHWQFSDNNAALDEERVLLLWLREIETFERTVLLCLDDLHTLGNTSLALITRLIDERPNNLKLLLASRFLPQTLARLRLDSKISWLTSRDLAFTDDQLQRLLILNDVKQAGRLVAALNSRLQGWPAGLSLWLACYRAAGKPQDPPVELARQEMSDYLQGETLYSLATEQQEFIQLASVLGSFNESLLQHCLGSSDYHPQLQAALTHNLFIEPVSDKPGWYRIHPVMAGLLNHQLSGPIRQAIHSRAFDWLSAGEDRIAALYHAREAGLTNEIVSWVESEAEYLLASLDIAALLEWFEALGETLLHRSPRLMQIAAWSWLFTQQREKAEPIVQALLTSDQLADYEQAALEGYLAHLAGQTKKAGQLCKFALEQLPADRFTVRILMSTTLSHLCLMNHDADGARIWNRLAQDLARQFQVASMEAQVLFDYARIELNRGHIGRSMSVINQGLELLSSSNKTCGLSLGRLLIYKAFLSWLMGEDRQQLADMMQQGISASTRSHDIAVCYGYALLAMAQTEQSEYDHALDLIDQAERLMQRWQVGVDSYQWLAMVKANIWISEGKLSRAQSYIDEFTQRQSEGLLARSEMFPMLPGFIVATRARLHLVSNNPELCIQETDTWLRTNGHNLMGLLVMLIRSVALKASKPAESEAQLRHAQRVLEREGIRMNLNHWIPNLTEGLNYSDNNANLPVNVTLSERELEVLRKIDQGLSNQEIADQLFISLHTVKTHARKINVKLGAKSRTQALHRAKELLLI